MSDSEKTTVKVKPGADPVQAALARITKLGAGGTAALMAAVIGAAQWINLRIEHTVQQAVQQAVAPLESRITKLETRMEIERERKEKP